MGEKSSPSARWLELLISVGRLHIVAIASMAALTFGWVFTGRYLWLMVGVCALDWFVVNLLNRVVDLKEDQLNAITGTELVGRHRRTILGLGFGLLVTSLVAVHLVAPAVTPLRVAGHLLGLAYNWPLLPGRRRLKRLYLVKNLASASAMVLTVFGYPLSQAGFGLQPDALEPDITPATIAVTIAFFFLFELSYEVIYDLRDAEGDRAAGVRSFAVVHGERGALRIIDSLIAASLIVFTAGFVLGMVPWRLFIMGAAPLLQLVTYKLMWRRGISSWDCVNLTWLGAVLFIVYHVWELLGLPGA